MNYHVKTRTLLDLVKLLFDCLQRCTSSSPGARSHKSPLHHTFQRKLLDSLRTFLTPHQYVPLIRLASEICHRLLQVTPENSISNDLEFVCRDVLIVNLMAAIVSVIPVSLMGKVDEDEVAQIIRNLSRIFMLKTIQSTHYKRANYWIASASLRFHLCLQNSPLGRKFNMPDVLTIEHLLDGVGITEHDHGLLSYEYVGDNVFIL